MEQNFNTYNGFPNDQNDNTFGGLSGSLIYPGPFQPISQQQWPNTPGWQPNGQDNYNYYPGQMTGSSGYFPNQQDFLPYDEGEDFYNNEDEDTEMDPDAQHPDTDIMGNSGNNSARQPQIPLRNPTVVPGATPHTPKTQNQSRAGSVTAEGSTSKPTSTAINDRAAELRAKLLAKRTVGSGTPTPEIKAVKANSSADGVKAEGGKPTERVETRSGPASSHLKSRGPSEFTKGTVPAQNETDDKSTATSIATLKERTNSSADIDGLFAETRAAMAAEDTQKKSGERGEKTKSSAVGQAAQASAMTPTETKTQTENAKDSRRSSLNESLGSSSLSEQGEIREDQPKPAKNLQQVEPAPSTAKPSNENEERTRRPQANSSANKPLTKQIDTKLANGHRNVPSGDNTPSIPPSSATRGLSNAAPLREAPRRAKVDRQDHFRERPLPAQDRRQLEQEDVRVADKPKNDSEYRRNQEIPYRRSSNSLAAIEANERAAAEYNRRNQKPVAAPESNERTVTDYKRSVSKPETQGSGVQLAPDVPKVIPEQQVIDYVEDLDEWLQMTGYHDRPYRKKALARYRKLIALDLQRAELEREAQVEHEERSHIARAQSIMPRESVETPLVRSVLSPRNIRTSSIFSMPPPPLPVKESHDDVGVKIKDLACRDSLTTTRRVEDDLRAYKNMQDSPASTSPTLKRRYADDDQDFGVPKPVEKMARIDDVEGSNTAQTSPYGPRSTAIPLESRITMDSGMSGRDRRRMSRSPEYRRRSMSPLPRRLSSSDTHLHRQLSGGPLEARNGHSPVRRSFSSRDSSPVRRGRESFPYNDYREDPYMRNNYEKKPSNRSMEYQPYVSRSDYQQYTSNRGRGKGFRGAYFHSRGGGYNRTFRPGAGSQDGEHAGSASLDLKASDSRYFIIKSWNYDNVKAAQNDGTWATQEHNLEKLTEAFNTCRNVILVFSVNKSVAFQGYARMESLPSSSIPQPSWARSLLWATTPPFRIRWITIADTKFARVGHLKNSLNEGQAVLVGRDGQEIEESAGLGLCECIDEEAERRGSRALPY